MSRKLLCAMLLLNAALLTAQQRFVEKKDNAEIRVFFEERSGKLCGSYSRSYYYSGYVAVVFLAFDKAVWQRFYSEATARAFVLQYCPAKEAR